MSKLQDALKRGNDQARNRSSTQDADTRAHAFQDGAHWVQQVLIPAIREGNAELEPEQVAFQLDLNLDRRSNKSRACRLLAVRSKGGSARSRSQNTRSTFLVDGTSGYTSTERRGENSEP